MLLASAHGAYLSSSDSNDATIIAIGASIGGPSAIAKILSQIPAGFPLPILLVIHIAPEFAQSLVEWIATRSNKLPVRVAVDGEPIPRPGPAKLLWHRPTVTLTVAQRPPAGDRYSAAPLYAVPRLTSCSSPSPVNAARRLSPVC